MLNVCNPLTFSYSYLPAPSEVDGEQSTPAKHSRSACCTYGIAE